MNMFQSLSGKTQKSQKNRIFVARPSTNKYPNDQRLTLSMKYYIIELEKSQLKIQIFKGGFFLLWKNMNY